MERLAHWLTQRERAGLRRRLPGLDRSRTGLVHRDGATLLDFASNDYLALTDHPRLKTAATRALERYGTGAGAARLMSGDLPLHRELEHRAARLVNKEAALLFGSGYLANTGVIPALVGRGDLVCADRLDHASIYDGCRLSGARLARFPHNDLDQLEKILKTQSSGRVLVVVESVYSMDGDLAVLADVLALKQRYPFTLMVDEAHGVGVFGTGGVAAAQGLGAGVDLILGTFGKALGSYGAFVAGDALLCDYLLNRARTFIFSTALPPPVAAASLAGIQVVEEAGGSLGRELLDRAATLRAELAAVGIETGGESQIVPVMVGDSHRATAVAARLARAGFHLAAVRPPTVPPGTARLRLSVTLAHQAADLRRLAGAVAEALAAVP